MPFVNLKTNVEVKNKEKVMNAIWELISIIPGKTPARTMISIEDKLAMGFAGIQEPCAMIETLVNPGTDMEKNPEYCLAIIDRIKKELDLPEKRIYATVAMVDCWRSIK